MLPTFVIGLREGLEAALIVGIIAAFLKRNNRSLKSMWVGVVAAIALSIAVGVTLEVISVGLPQAQQEGLESVIGAVAVVMVTAMIVWMSGHARTMRKDLEAEASSALNQGSVFALAAMAFLAVLREGFETSVFLLAAFQSSVSPLAAGAGAVIGLLVAVAIGYGIYRGGVKLNLGRFFTITGVFLVFVAAGLVMSSLRTAHEAGWLVVGQDPTVDLSWLVSGGSVQAALITGVLGIPSDPRVVEVLGWVLYLVPVLLFVLWPAAHRPKQRAYRLQFSIAGALAVAALVLAFAVPAPSAQGGANDPVALTGSDGQQVGTAQLVVNGSDTLLQTTVLADSGALLLPAGGSTNDTHLGEDAQKWSIENTLAPTGFPTTLTLDEVSTLNGGRTPVGVNRSTNPGPFEATWQVTQTTTAWLVGTTLLDAARQGITTLTLSGGGLTAPRTVTVSGGQTAAEALSWTVAPDASTAVAGTISGTRSAADEAALFTTLLPIALLIAALASCSRGCAGGLVLVGRSRRPRRPLATRSAPTATPPPRRPPLPARSMNFMTSSPTNARRTRAVVAAALVAAGSLLLAGCSTSAAAPSSSGSASGAAPVSNGAAQVTVTLTGNACKLDYASAPAGPVTFVVTNTDAAGISEVELMSDKRILGERENVVAGLKSASFTVTLTGGTYQVNCPGADEENTPFTVTGEAATAASDVQSQLAEGTTGYGAYVEDQATNLVSAVATLDAAIQSGDVAAAQKAYAAARPFYERIEPVAESFADLDPAVDARIADVDPGTEWTGFHPIEKDIFETGAITDSTKSLSTKLVSDIANLQKLTVGLTYKPEELANGASSLLEEVQSSKITGEEEAYSHIDLVDFAANVEGSEQAVRVPQAGAHHHRRRPHRLDQRSVRSRRRTAGHPTPTPRLSAATRSTPPT